MDDVIMTGLVIIGFFVVALALLKMITEDY